MVRRLALNQEIGVRFPGPQLMKFFLSFFLLLATVNSAWADQFYCLLFAYDSKPVPLPCKCHVWGTFVQVSDDGKLVKEISISWEPDKISYFDFSRPGWHSTDSLDFAVKKNKSVRMWGPFEVKEAFFLKAVKQHAAQGRYKFLDGCTRRSAQNCIHRLSDLAGPHRTGVYWGWWAADSVYKHYRRQGVIYDTKNGDQVIRLLHIDRYAIKRMRQ